MLIARTLESLSFAGLKRSLKPFAAAGFFVAATAAMTYPLVLRFWNTVPFHVDPLFLTWTLDWEWHQLFTHPLALFNADIFWPYRGTLAYSELALPDLAVFGPVEALTRNPIAAFNVSLFAVIAASGWTAYLFARRIIGEALPAIGAGVLFAFCQYRWGQYIHIQMMSTLWIPLTFLFLDRYVRGRDQQRLRRHRTDAFVAVACFCFQALSSFYMGLFLAAGLIAYVLATQCQAQSRLRLAEWGWLSAAGLLGALLLLPFAIPYFQAEASLGFVRDIRDVALGGAALNSFLRPASGSLIYDRLLPLGRWLASPALTIQEQAFFPGLVTVALAIVGVSSAWKMGARFYLLMTLFSGILCLGPFLLLHDGDVTPVPLPYLLLYLAVPGFRSIRLPAREAILAFFWCGLLVAFGLRRLGRRSRILIPLGIGLLLLDNLAIPRPAVEVPVGNAIPSVYQWLAKQPNEPIVELPIAPSRYNETTYPTLAGYEYFATYHHHPSVVGYSSFTPPLYFTLIDRTASFPNLRSLSFLQGEGVRYVIVHNGDLPASRARQIAARAATFPDDLKLAGVWGTDTVYLLRPPASAAVIPTIHVALPAAVAPGHSYSAVVQFLEPSEAAYLLKVPVTLHLMAHWVGYPGNSATKSTSQTLNIPLDYEQGVTSLPIRLRAPEAHGSYRLELRATGGQLGFVAAGDVSVGTGVGKTDLRLDQFSLEGTILRAGAGVVRQAPMVGHAGSTPHRISPAG